MNIWLAAARTLQRDEYLAKEHLKPLVPTKFCVYLLFIHTTQEVLCGGVEISLGCLGQLWG